MQRLISGLARNAGLAAGLAALAAADVRIETTAMVTSNGPLNGQLTQVSLRCTDTGVPGSTAGSVVHDVLPDGSWFAIGSTLFMVEASSTAEVVANAASASILIECDLVGGGSMHLILVDTMAPLLLSTPFLGQSHGTYLISETTTHAHGFNLPGGVWGFMLGSVIEVTISDYGQDPGATYCAGLRNSTGRAAQLRLNGSSAAAANALRLDAFDLPTQAFGFFLASRDQGFVANPGASQGNLCLGGAVGRFVGPGQIQNSGTTGAYSLQLDLTQMPTPTGLVAAQAGQSWSFQSWYRDTSNGMSVSNFTSAATVQLQ